MTSRGEYIEFHNIFLRILFALQYRDFYGTRDNVYLIKWHGVVWKSGETRNDDVVDGDEQANVFSGFEIELFILGAMRYWDRPIVKFEASLMDLKVPRSSVLVETVGRADCFG